MPFHTVQQGETLLGLASKNGLDSWEDIVNAPGLLEACEILFGDDARLRLAEYRESLAQ